jgi:hypothetical protein
VLRSVSDLHFTALALTEALADTVKHRHTHTHTHRERERERETMSVALDQFQAAAAFAKVDSECLAAVKNWVSSSRNDSKTPGDRAGGQAKILALLSDETDKGLSAIVPSLLLLGFSERHDAHYLFAVIIKVSVSPQMVQYKENQRCLFSTPEGRNLLERLIRLSSGSSSQTQPEATHAVNYLLSSSPPRSALLHTRRASNAEISADVIVADLRGEFICLFVS